MRTSKIPVGFIPFFSVTLWVTAAWVSGAELHRLPKSGKLLLSEDFSAPALPRSWEPTGHLGSFSIVDGALQAVCPPADGHGPAISVPLTGRDLTITFGVKFTQPGYFLFLLDGENQFGGVAHLLRVILTADRVQVAQDRGSPASKGQQKKIRDDAVKAGRKPATPTTEQLADPQFYRIETLARQSGKFADGEWHHVLIELSGNEVGVQVDGLPPLRGTGTVLDVKKSLLGFVVAQAGTILVDNVKVWENARSAR